MWNLVGAVDRHGRAGQRSLSPQAFTAGETYFSHVADLLRDDPLAQRRATELRARVAKAGMTLAEFGRRAGFGRSVVWRLAKGGRPSAVAQQKIDAVLGRQLAPVNDSTEPNAGIHRP